MVDFVRLPLHIVSKILTSIGLCSLVFVKSKVGMNFELGMSIEW